MNMNNLGLSLGPLAWQKNKKDSRACLESLDLKMQATCLFLKGDAKDFLK
jgi:hypothetical protein